MVEVGDFVMTWMTVLFLAGVGTATFYMGWATIYFCSQSLKNLLFRFKGMSSTKMTNPNEKLMLVFGFFVVMMWVFIAALASYFSIVQERDITDSQLTVIGLLGGPALLIITSVLDLFKGKESAKINILPDQLNSDVKSAEAVEAHSRMLEQIKLEHDLNMEQMAKAHELNMEAFGITGTNSVATGAKADPKATAPKKKSDK